jgi:hypothetical protein
MDAAAILTLVMPDPQKRSRVTALARNIVPRIERRHPAEIAALRTALGTGTPDDVVDVGGIDPGAIGQSPQHRRAKLLRMNTR